MRYYIDPKSLKNIRLMLGLSQREFADKVGVSSTTVSRWEQGRASPSQLAQARLESIRKTIIEEERQKEDMAKSFPKPSPEESKAQREYIRALFKMED